MIITETQKNYLIDKVNEKVNLPFLGERAERIVFKKAIDKILKKLEQELPKEILDYLSDINHGFILNNEDDFQELVESTVNFLNKKINLPLMNEEKEKQLFTVVIKSLFAAMREGKQLAA